MEPRKESSGCQRCRSKPKIPGQVKEGVRSKDLCPRVQDHLSALGWGLSHWKRATLKGPAVSLSVEEMPKGVSEISPSQEGSRAPFWESKSPKFRVCLPLLWTRHQLQEEPRNRSQVQALWSCSLWFCQAGGPRETGAWCCRDHFTSMGSNNRAKWRDSGPGDINSPLNSAKPKAGVTFRLCLMASPWERSPEPTDSFGVEASLSWLSITCNHKGLQ